MEFFSLSGTPLNELIWAHYGGSHYGFCIEYDIDKLIVFEPLQLNCLDVEYSDSTPSITLSDLLLSANELQVLQKLLGTKSSRWEYESEMRVITTKAGTHQYDYRAVKSIYFGLRCPETIRNQIMETLSGRGIVYRQIVSNGLTYLLQAKDVIDPFSEAPRYKLGVATIAEGAIMPDYLKPEQKVFSEYLYKAAEIVRREPYCLEVQLVDFSGSKSTPETPVIFVQYKWAEDKYINHYLKLHEIDEQYKLLNLEKV